MVKVNIYTKFEVIWTKFYFVSKLEFWLIYNFLSLYGYGM